MKTNDFKTAVDEIRNNGGSRQTMFVKEQWRNREMTIFGFMDGTAEVFENARPYMCFNSVAEALFTLNAMQAEYDRQVVEDRRRMMNNGTSNVHIDTYSSPADWYARAPRGTYFGD